MKSTPFRQLLISGALTAVYLILSSCDSERTTVLTISQCLDQNETPLSRKVAITVDGKTQQWSSGIECRFNIQFSKDKHTVSVAADAGESYIYASPEEYTLSTIMHNPLILRFFKPYLISVAVADKQGHPLPDVKVNVNDNFVGTTNEDGVSTWIAKDLSLKAGSRLKVGFDPFKYQIFNQADNITILRKGKFDYMLTATLEPIVVEPTEIPPEPVPVVVTPVPLISTPMQPPTDDIISTPPPPIETQIIDYRLYIHTRDAKSNEALPGVHIKLGDKDLGETSDYGILSGIYRLKSDVQTKKISFTKNRYETVTISPHGDITFSPEVKEYRITADLAPRHILEFTTTPPGALVTLRGSGSAKASYQDNTPTTFSVEPDFYGWSVSLEGYRIEKSNTQLDLLTRDELRYHFELQPKVAEGDPIEMAQSAYNQGNIRKTIALYSLVSPPKSKDRAIQYITAQNNLGIIFLNDKKDYEQAIGAFKNALRYADRDYALHFNLASAYYQIKDCNRTIRHLDQVLKLKSLIKPEKLRSIELDVFYLKAVCQFETFRNEKDDIRKRRLAFRALSALNNFVSQVSNDMSGFKEKKRDANEKIKTIKSQIQTLDAG